MGVGWGGAKLEAKSKQLLEVGPGVQGCGKVMEGIGSGSVGVLPEWHTTKLDTGIVPDGEGRVGYKAIGMEELGSCCL